MGLFDWLFRRKPPRREAGIPAQRVTPSERANRESSDPNSDPCPQCGTRARQTRADGRCVTCGTFLSEALRVPTATSQAGERSGARRRSKLPRPQNVRQFGPMVTFDSGAVQMIMDRDAFEYTYGDADGPDPAQ